MTTGEATRSTAYSRIVSNLMALREEVRGTSPEEANAIDKIVTDVMAVQMYDRYVTEVGIYKK